MNHTSPSAVIPSAVSLSTISSPEPESRFLTVEECQRLAKRASGFAMGGGKLGISIDSSWTGYTRWARNAVQISGDVRNTPVTLIRVIKGAQATVISNQITDTALDASCRRAERVLLEQRESFDWGANPEFTEEFPRPPIWSDATYNLGAEARANAMRELVSSCEQAGMLAAGYIQVSANGRAVMSDGGRSLYYPFTYAQYSVTVRDPDGTGSGFAGMDHHDWTKIDAKALTEKALDKCLRSRNPVAIEPGRYTTILEPQAVCDLVESLISSRYNERQPAEYGEGHIHFKEKVVINPGRFAEQWGVARFGDRIIDERLSLSADPMDPELAFPPFEYAMNYMDENARLQVYHPVTWIENGVLKNLAYPTRYGITSLGANTGLPTSGGFRMTGGTTTIDEMIQTTRRGIIVTRFSDVQTVDLRSGMVSGFTRDGLWLVENGKISKPIKNFRFMESPFIALNQVDQIGKPERVFHPWNYSGVICPALKVRDFSFTHLFDAV